MYVIFHMQCDTLVEEYGKEFVNDLVNDIDPLQICKV